MMPPSDRAIDLFLSKVSSNRNRAILYLGITDSSVDDAVALFNSKPDASFRAAISRSAVQFRRPLANGAKGYEDKYGVIHLETSTEDENDEEVEIVGGLTDGNEQIRMREYEHRPLRAATSEHEEAPGTMSRSYLGGQITIKSTEKRAKKNRRASNRDPTFEPEENSGPLDQMSPTGHKRLPQLRHRGRFAISSTGHKRLPQQRHRGRFAREEKILDTELETADDEKPISARTRRSTVGRLPKKKQCSRPRSSLPTYKRSPKKRATASTPPFTPRKKIPNPTTPATPTYRSTLLESSEEYELYLSPPDTAQSRFKQAKKNTAGVANPCTPLSSNVFGMASYPTPVSFSSRPKTSSISLNTSNHQHQLEEILPSEFHRSSFESMSPLAIKSDYYSKIKTHHHKRDTLEIPLQNPYHSNNGNKSHRHQLHPSKISLQDPYLAPTSSISTFSFHSAMNLAREKRKWLLINIQSATNPACGVLNRDLWRHPDIADIVSQSFLFLQLDQKDERVEPYLGIYYGVFDLDEEGEGMICASNNRKFLRPPHIALLDPVSGHRWKVWDGPGLPDKDLFLADLCEYEMVGEGGWCEWGKGVIRERDELL